jgi:hypothetical protein
MPSLSQNGESNKYKNKFEHNLISRLKTKMNFSCQLGILKPGTSSVLNFKKTYPRTSFDHSWLHLQPEALNENCNPITTLPWKINLISCLHSKP